MSYLQEIDDDDLDKPEWRNGVNVGRALAPDEEEEPSITAHATYDNEGDLVVEWILPDGSRFCIGIGAMPDAMGWWYVTKEDSQIGELPVEMLRHIRWNPEP